MRDPDAVLRRQWPELFASVSSPPDLLAFLTRLRWSQMDCAKALGCTRRDVRDALEGREPWLSVLCAACETALRLQATVQRELGPHRRG